jgi:hypothetical protein
MEEGPSSETNSRLSAQKIPQISWNRYLRFSANKMSELIPNLSQINPSHYFTLYIFSSYFNINLNSTPRSLNDLILFRF